MKNICIRKMLVVITMAFVITFFTSFSAVLNSTNLPENASFSDLFRLIELSIISSLKPAISAILASILGFFTNNQKEIKE